MLQVFIIGLKNGTYYVTPTDLRKVFDMTCLYMILIFSIVGIILNSISVFIFAFSKNTSTKFLQFLKFYSFNSLGISTLDFLFVSTYLWSDHTAYKYNESVYYEKKEYLIIYIIYINCWSFLYTFSGILDIFIVYERIQIYLSHLKFLRKMSAGTISFVVLFYSLIINIPLDISSTTFQKNISIDTTEPITLYSYALREFYYNEFFLLFLFLSNFIRDIISFIVEIILNIILIVTMTRFYKTRMTISIQNLSTFAFKRTDVNNSKIAFLMNFVSALFHIITFSFMILLNLSTDAYFFVSKIFAVIFSLRHALNIFLFLKLNKKFRRNFYVLIPKCLLKLKNKRRTVRPSSSIQYKSCEHVNLESITTYL